jgi:V/A-type H+-transporting ATPase subunit E
MDKKIQELTDKIYQEGVEKGNVEANRIVAEAQAKAQQIEADAKAEAARIVAEAQKQAQELADNTKSEIRLYGNQAVEALKTEVADIVTDTVAKNAVDAAMSDKEFMQQVILALTAEWAKREELVIEADDAALLTKFFTAKAKELLNKGVTIKQVNGLKTEFVVSPANGAYKVTFGEEEFVNYFKAFLRPQLVELLF